MAFGQRLHDALDHEGATCECTPPIGRVSARPQSIPPHRLPSTGLVHNIYRFFGPGGFRRFAVDWIYTQPAECDFVR